MSNRINNDIKYVMGNYSDLEDLLKNHYKSPAKDVIQMKDNFLRAQCLAKALIQVEGGAFWGADFIRLLAVMSLANYESSLLLDFCPSCFRDPQNPTTAEWIVAAKAMLGRMVEIGMVEQAE